MDWSKDFVGRKALLEKKRQGTRNRIVSIILSDKRAIPLGNEPVVADGKIVGRTTSAAFGFRIGAPVALANIADPEARRTGAGVVIDIAGTRFQGRVVAGATFDPQGHRMRSVSGVQ